MINVMIDSMRLSGAALLLMLAAAAVIAAQKPATKTPAAPPAADARVPTASVPTNQTAAGRSDPFEFEGRGRNLIFEPAMVATVAASPDGKFLAAGTGFFNQAGELIVWDVAARKEKWVRRYDIGIRSVAFSPDGKLVASGHFDTMARLTSADTGDLAATLEGHTGGVNAVAFSPNGDVLVTGSLDKTARVWDVSTRKLQTTLIGHTAEIYSVAVSTDGKTIATAGRVYACGITLPAHSVRFSDLALNGRNFEHGVRADLRRCRAYGGSRGDKPRGSLRRIQYARRWRDEGIFSALRYFVIVRRASL